MALFFLFIGRRDASASEDVGNELRIASYNVENYLEMPRRIDGKLRTNAGKPLPEKEAVTRVIGTLRPDVLGLMEIGESRQLEDVRRRLSAAGMDFPYSEYVQGNDTTRHIALLTRFPIIERHSQGDLPLSVNGMTLHSPRGILDVTLEPSPGYRLRILCLHLKAKLEVEEYKEADLRLEEARQVRRYVREILRADPETRLILMGDFNGTRNEEAIRNLTGESEGMNTLRLLPLSDDRGELWTEYWSAADIYSRIDYILVSKKLEPEIDSGHSLVARPAFWNEASDHCPVMVSLKAPVPPSQQPSFPSATP
jgi:endonuclease/exonuclease/phosphatase family metal-dependent hydrolase